MIGIILISHAHIASETKFAVEHILGKQDFFETIDIPNSDSLTDEQLSFDTLLESVDHGEGVLVMVDLFGATPCKLVLEAKRPEGIEVIAGFNVPAVIKAISFRQSSESLRELAKTSVSSGQQYLQLMTNTNKTQEIPID